MCFFALLDRLHLLAYRSGQLQCITSQNCEPRCRRAPGLFIGTLLAAHNSLSARPIPPHVSGAQLLAKGSPSVAPLGLSFRTELGSGGLQLRIDVHDDHIIISCGDPLELRHQTKTDDDEILAVSLQVANKKARQLGWIV